MASRPPGRSTRNASASAASGPGTCERQDDGVEARVGVGERAGVAGFEREVREAGAEAAGAVEEHRRRVEPDDARDAGQPGEVAADRARAAAGLEDARVGREGRGGEQRRADLALARILRPGLHRRDQRLEHCRLGGGDVGIDVRHGGSPDSLVRDRV
jgi:hypothetical protein